MNLAEFGALKAGDKIENPMGHSTGEVAATAPNGVHVSWDGNKQTFFYSVQTTAWMGWNKVEAQGEAQ